MSEDIDMTDGSAPESEELLSATTDVGAGRPKVVPQAGGQSEARTLTSPTTTANVSAMTSPLSSAVLNAPAPSMTNGHQSPSSPSSDSHDGSWFGEDFRAALPDSNPNTIKGDSSLNSERDFAASVEPESAAFTTSMSSLPPPPPPPPPTDFDPGSFDWDPSTALFNGESSLNFERDFAAWFDPENAAA